MISVIVGLLFVTTFPLIQ